MAATLRDILLMAGRDYEHQGFGQESVPPKKQHGPENTALAFFVMHHLRAPDNEVELKAFMKAREAGEAPK